MGSGITFTDYTWIAVTINSTVASDVYDEGSGNTRSGYNYTEVRELCKLQQNSSELVRLPVCSSDAKKTHSNILTYTLVICIAFVMFTMGCKVRLKEIWMRFKVPHGISVGFVCQFGIMPVCAFGVAKMLSLSRAQALVVLIMGCLPGGGASNLVCYWCDADIDLSIAMTTISTVLAFAMMPLNLFLYSREWSTEAVAVPFWKISVVLAIFVVPVSVGATLNYCWPKVAKVMAKVGAVLGIIVVTAVSAMGIVLYPEAWNIPTEFWIVGAVLPLAGYVFGFTSALLLGHVTKSPQLQMPQVRTIAVETGLQNVQMCSTIIQLNYKCTCLILDMYSYPLVYFVYQIGEAILLCTGYKIFARFCKSDSRSIPISASDSTVHRNNYADAEMCEQRLGDSEGGTELQRMESEPSDEALNRNDFRTCEKNGIVYGVTEEQTRL